MAFFATFVKGGRGGRDRKSRIGQLNNFFVQILDVFDSGGFGFVSQRKFEQESEGGELGAAPALNKIIIEFGVI